MAHEIEITDTQIEQLHREAAAAGDLRMAQICTQALNHYPFVKQLPQRLVDAARAECARVIAEAGAQQ